MHKKYLFYFVWMQKVIKITFEAKATKEKISKVIESINKNGCIVSIDSLNDFDTCFKENNIEYKNLQVEINVDEEILKKIYSIHEAYIKYPNCTNERIRESNIDEMYVAIQTYGYIYEDDEDFHRYDIVSKIEANDTIKIKTICQHNVFDCVINVPKYEFKMFFYDNDYKYLIKEDKEILTGGMDKIMELIANIDKINKVIDINI